MNLTRYRDEFVTNDVGDQFGNYVISYATEHHLVEVHLFRAANGELVVYVTKSPGMPIADVHEAVKASAERHMRESESRFPSVRYVYDPAGMTTSGSL